MQFPELQYDFEYSVAEIDEDIAIAYTDEGNKESKEVLLFIHGLASYLPAWSKVIPLLKNHFRCIAIDLPGYGKSSAGVHSGSMFFYADAISKFAHKLNLQKVSLVGHSMGGHVSITTALTYPKLIDKLILLAPAGFETFTDEEKVWYRKNYTPEIFSAVSDDQVRLNYEINFFKMPADTEIMIQDRIRMKSWKNFNDYSKVVSNSLCGMLDYPVFDKLNLITQPTLILFGKNDNLIPNFYLHKNITVEQIALAGSKQIPKARLVMIDECGHFMQYEKEEIISSEIKNFRIN
jgi:pimeloyl-ACP methyl ester carboxylesterase